MLESKRSIINSATMVSIRGFQGAKIYPSRSLAEALQSKFPEGATHHTIMFADGMELNLFRARHHGEDKIFIENRELDLLRDPARISQVIQGELSYFDPTTEFSLSKHGLKGVMVNPEKVAEWFIRKLGSPKNATEDVRVRIGGRLFKFSLKLNSSEKSYTCQYSMKDALESALRIEGVMLQPRHKYGISKHIEFEPERLLEVARDLGCQEQTRAQLPGTPKYGDRHSIHIAGQTLVLEAKFNNGSWVWAHNTRDPIYRNLARVQKTVEEANKRPVLSKESLEEGGFVPLTSRNMRTRFGSQLVNDLVRDLVRRVNAGELGSKLPIPAEIQSEKSHLELVRLGGKEGRMAAPLEQLFLFKDARFMRQFYPETIFTMDFYDYKRIVHYNHPNLVSYFYFPKKYAPAVIRTLGDPKLLERYAEVDLQVGDRRIPFFSAINGSVAVWCTEESNVKYMRTRETAKVLGIPHVPMFNQKSMVRFSIDALSKVLNLPARCSAVVLQDAIKERGKSVHLGSPSFKVFWVKDVNSGSLVPAVKRNSLENVHSWLREVSPEAERSVLRTEELENLQRSLPRNVNVIGRIGVEYNANDFLKLSSDPDSQGKELYDLSPSFFNQLVGTVQGLPSDFVYSIQVPATEIYFKGYSDKGSLRFAICEEDLQGAYRSLSKLVPHSSEFEVENFSRIVASSIPREIPQRREVTRKLLSQLGDQTQNQFVAELKVSDSISFKLYREQAPYGSSWVMADDNFTALLNEEVLQALGVSHFERFDPTIHFAVSSVEYDSSPVRHARRKLELLKNRLVKVKIGDPVPEDVIIGSVKFHPVIKTSSHQIIWVSARNEVDQLNSIEFESELYQGLIPPHSPINSCLMSVQGFRRFFLQAQLCYDKVAELLPEVVSKQEAQSHVLLIGDDTETIRVVQAGTSNFTWEISLSGLVKLARYYEFKPKLESFWSIESPDQGAKHIVTISNQARLWDLAFQIVDDNS